MPFKSIPKRVFAKIKSRFKLSVLLLSFCFITISVIIVSQLNLRIEGYGETLFSTDNLVAQWNFNALSGTAANNDAEGTSCGGTPSDCDGTLTNFEDTSGQDVVTASGWTTANKKWGAGALMFDGSNDYLTVPDRDSLDLTTAGTIETWVNRQATGLQMLVTKASSEGSTNTQYQLMTYSDNTLVFRWGSDSDSIISIGTLPLDEWVYLTTTYDGNYAKIYINGQLDNSVEFTTDAVANSDPVRFGTRGDGYNFDGYIDSTRIYNRALSATEILDNYDGTTPSSTPTPTPNNNLAQTGSGRTSISNASGDPLTVMTDGILDNGNDDFDSWNGNPRTEDFWGIAFNQSYTYNRVVYTTGQHFNDGGWFDDSGLIIQVRQSGNWVDVTGMSIDPTPPGAGLAAVTSYTFTFDSITGDAIRVYGVPVEVVPQFQFTSINEFEIFNDGDVTLTPTLTPMPAANDDFADRIVISTFPSSTEGSNYEATSENPDEPKPINNTNYNSVWYSWESPITGSVYVGICDASFTSFIGPYIIEGEDPVSLVNLYNIDWGPGNADCTYGPGHYSPIDVTTGTTYYIQIVSSTENITGTFTLTIGNELPTPTPEGTPTPSLTPTPAFGSSVNIPSSYVNIGLPEGMVMLPDGNIWYVDNMNYRLVKYNPTTNTILRTVGRYGIADGEFSKLIIDITRDNDGYLYILATNGVVYKLDSNGGFMAEYDLSNLPDDMGLYDPWSITYDSYSDTIFIANRLKHKIEKFSKNLVFIDSFGQEGEGDGEFGYTPVEPEDREAGPSAITTDADGKIYVSDEYNTRIQVFNPDYSFIRDIHGPWTKIEDEHGWGTTDFTSPRGIVILSDGTITVCNNNWQYSAVEQFDSLGVHINSFGGAGLDVWNMKAPKFIVKDTDDNIYVSDTGDIGIKAITKYGSDGTYVSTIRNNYFSDGRFYNPSSPIYDGDGNMYIMDGDVETRRIQKFSSGGTYIATVIPTGVLGGAAYNHIFGPYGRMYVSSRNGIQVFDEVSNTSWTDNTGLFIGGAGSGDGQFNDASDMAFDASGNLYVADAQNHRIQKLIDNGYGQYIYDANNGSIQFGGGWLGGEDTFEIGELDTPSSIVFDSTYEHLFVVDHRSFKKFTPAGVYEADIGVAPDDYQLSVWLGIDSNDDIYLSDTWGKQILVYDSATGDELNTFGYYGGGQMQFDNAGKVTFNPDGVMIVGDSNGRIQALSVGYRILNLISSANVIRLDSGHVGESLSNQSWIPSQEDPLTEVPARLMFGDYVVADFTVNLTADRDWGDVNVQTLPLNSKSLVVNLNPTSAPGLSATHSLYLARYANQTSVTVCPNANALSQVAPNCTGAYTLEINVDNELSSQSISGRSYWKIDNLTGTGAFSSLFSTTFALKDEMSRLQVNVESSHRIEFGTSSDLTHDGDTIKITFGTEWGNMSALSAVDISLIGASYPMTLSDSGPGENIWGFGIADNVITLTAPSSGTLQYIESGSNIILLIDDGIMINPVGLGSYQIGIRIDSDIIDGPFVETGAIEVPIVDSDTVDVKGYVNAYIHFDIDTGTNGIDNDLGVDPLVDCDYTICKIHGGENATAGSNYTIDMGELKSTYVNKSQEVQMHSDGISGAVNSIYFDLTTNAQTGAIITVASANEGLQGPGDSKLSSVATDGDEITINSGLYGFNLTVESSTLHGVINRNSSCTLGTTFCSPGSIASPKEVFNTGDLPVDGARMRMDLAAAAAYTNTPGAYSDTLTFVAIATF